MIQLLTVFFALTNWVVASFQYPLLCFLENIQKRVVCKQRTLTDNVSEQTNEYIILCYTVSVGRMIQRRRRESLWPGRWRKSSQREKQRADVSRDTECRKMCGDNNEISSARAEDSNGPAAALCQASPLLTGSRETARPFPPCTSCTVPPPAQPSAGPTSRALPI